MHIYFSGIGGTGIGPLALIAKESGYDISGSDARESKYLDYLKQRGITDIHVGQSREEIEKVQRAKPIDWFVHSSAISSDHPEFKFCQENDIRISKRDELLNEILSQKHLKLIAVAGTHGKTTTTAMVVWLMKQLGLRVSYSVGAKIGFGEMGHYEEGSEYFVYEADEFDRNFLAFHPFYSIVAGVAYDHHEIFPTEEAYRAAFSEFLAQSQRAILWQEDAKKLNLNQDDEKYTVETYDNSEIEKLSLAGLYNRRDAWLAVKAVSQIVGPAPQELYDKMNQFPGVSRRFEKIASNLYTDYAHTPEKIKGVMSVAKEMAAETGQKIVVVYEPLTNRRMHHTKDQHHDIFAGASAIYWVPSFLAREDPDQPVLKPEELIKSLNPELQTIARPMELNEHLKEAIKNHLKSGDLVICLSGGGGGSLDEWLRGQFK